MNKYLKFANSIKENVAKIKGSNALMDLVKVLDSFTEEQSINLGDL